MAGSLINARTAHRGESAPGKSVNILALRALHGGPPRRFGLVSGIAVVALAITVAAISSASVAIAQGFEPRTALYWLDAASADEAGGRLTDLGNNQNHGTMLNFENPLLAFGGSGAIGDPHFITFDGVDDFIGTDLQIQAPDVVSLEITFRTTVAGGKVAGFESSQNGLGGSLFDRHLYIDTDGHLRFGAWNGGAVTVRSQAPVNDGQWHTAVATLDQGSAGNTSTLALYVDGDLQETLNSTRMTVYNGYWRIGGGGLSSWPSWTQNFFQGDVTHFRVYATASPVEATPTPTRTPVPPTATFTPAPSPVPSTPTTASPVPQVTPTVITPGGGSGGSGDGTAPRLGVKGDVSNNTLRLDITTSGLANPAATMVYVVREDGTEWLVGPATAEMTWTGEPVSGRYRIEARELADGEQQARVVAAASIPVFAAVASTGEVIGAVGVGVAIVTIAAVAASNAGGFSATAFGQNIMKFFLTEKVRQRTRKFDRARLKSWHAAVIAFVLMALLVALGKPGALRVESFAQALLVAGVAAVIFRGGMLLGQLLLSRLADRKPRYLIWIAGTLTMALTSVVLHSPFGYTGYVDRSPADRAREARFAGASLGLMVAMAGLFLLIGLAARLVFAETGITMTVGALGVSALPFPGLAGNAIWKWSRPAAIGVALAAFVPYFLFQYGLLPPGVILALSVCGALTFASVVGLEMWRRREQPQAPAPAPAAAG